MFQNLSKGSILYGLDNKNGIKVFTGTIDAVSFPYSKNAQSTFGQLPEMVIDISATVDGVRKDFKQIPCNTTIADFGQDVCVLADNKDSLVNYIKTQKQISKNIVNSCPKHQERIPQYDAALQELNPELVNENVVKELKDQVVSMQNQFAEMLSLFKSGAVKPNIQGHENN